MNWRSVYHLHSYTQPLIPSVMIFRSGEFKKYLGLDGVMREFLMMDFMLL